MNVQKWFVILLAQGDFLLHVYFVV